MNRHVRRAFPLAVVAACLLTMPLGGDNGDVLTAADTLAGTPLVDITQDTRSAGPPGSYWIVGANGNSTNSHRIYHLSSDLGTELGFIENPHPAGVIPDITSNRGIAFHTQLRTLFVLSLVRTGPRQGYVVQETDPDSVDDAGFLGAAFILLPFDLDANLFGLAFDVLRREFWTLDTRNDKVLRFSTDGTITDIFTIPGKARSASIVPGRGVAFDLDTVGATAVPFVYATFGDIFHTEPTSILQLDGRARINIDNTTFGIRTGVEVPLGTIPATNLGGFHVSRLGGQKRVTVVAAGGEIYQLEMAISNPLPPAELSCSLTLSSQVALSWKNHGAELGGSYSGEIQVLRNGVPFMTLAGDTESLTDTTPVDGTSMYSLRASETLDGPLSAEGLPCEVTVGMGGLVNFAAVPGSSAHDVTHIPQTGEILVTDSLEGKIFRFNADLEPIGEIPGPWSGPNDPGGIAFIPQITLGFPPIDFTDLLAVCRTTGKQLRIIDLTGAVKTSISLNLEEATPRIGGLTFIPDPPRFALHDTASGVMYVVDASGSVLQRCPPGFLLGVAYDRGITYDPLRETLLSTLQEGNVREFFIGPGCPANNVEDFPPIELRGLGENFDEPGFIGGIQIAGNTLLVTGRQSKALYQILIFPFENSFVRGDVNSSGIVDVSDVVALAEYLFMTAATPDCLDTADANDDGDLDIADPVYLAFYLFLGASTPPEPFPTAGRDPTFRDNLGCAQ